VQDEARCCKKTLDETHRGGDLGRSLKLVGYVGGGGLLWGEGLWNLKEGCRGGTT